MDNKRVSLRIKTTAGPIGQGFRAESIPVNTESQRLRFHRSKRPLCPVLRRCLPAFFLENEPLVGRNFKFTPEIAIQHRLSEADNFPVKDPAAINVIHMKDDFVFKSFHISRQDDLRIV